MFTLSLQMQYECSESFCWNWTSKSSYKFRSHMSRSVICCGGARTIQIGMIMCFSCHFCYKIEWNISAIAFEILSGILSMTQNLSDACSVASVPVSKPAKSTDGDRFTMTTYQKSKIWLLSWLDIFLNKFISKVIVLILSWINSDLRLVMIRYFPE